MKRQLTFQFFDSHAEALAFAKTIKPHLRRSVTPWSSKNGKEHKFIVWYKY